MSNQKISSFVFFKNTFKSLSLTCILVFSFILVACDDVNITDKNRITPQSFFRDATDAEAALVGTYGPLTVIMGWGRMMGAILTIHRGDIVDTNPQPNVYDPGTFVVNSGDARVNEGWQTLWRIVQRANNVLENAPGIDMNENRKAEMLGEARFLRGLAYFYLVNMWGNIPLITDAVSSPDQLEVGQVPPEEVWAQIITDFTEAQEVLPQTWPDSDIGRATWGAATAMLGKSYLFNEDWTNASSEFKKILNSGLYELVDDYQFNFLREGSNNAESIFELQYESTPNGNWGPSGTQSPLRGQAWEPDVAPPGFTSQQSVTINKWVFDLFMKEKTVVGEIDPRAFATILWDYPGAKVYQQDFNEALSEEDQNKVFVRKYLNFYRETSLVPGSWGESNNNYRMIRFADVLLMFAEAENEASGSTQEVLNAINRVRARANMPSIEDGLSKSEMREKIRDERVLELAIEGHRHLDLKRWGIMADRFINNPQFREAAGQNFERGKDELLPIPRQDIDSNPMLEQNPGF